MKKKTSVLIVDASGKENKIIQIPTRILVNWKKYFLILNGIISVLLVIIGIFIYQKTSDLYKEKLVRANRIKSMIDIKQVEESFKSIDRSIYKINEFMNQRGLDNLKIEQTGGLDNKVELTEINEISTDYSSKIKELQHKIENTPFGVPINTAITSRFGGRNNPFGKAATENHGGIDFRGAMGSPVKATASGRVEFAGPRGGYGNCIIIKHGKRLKTLFGHLSKINVNAGQNIALGDVIGLVGSTGRSTGPHLHYEIFLDNQRTDPETFLKL